MTSMTTVLLPITALSEYSRSRPNFTAFIGRKVALKFSKEKYKWLDVAGNRMADTSPTKVAPVPQGLNDVTHLYMKLLAYLA